MKKTTLKDLKDAVQVFVGTIQDVTESNRLSKALRKVLGKENISDALTKYLDRPELTKHLAGMHLVFEDGRAASAPALSA